jgi:hypothetical protein
VGEWGVKFPGDETDGFAVDEARREASRSVEEEGEIAAAEGLGEFGCPLLAAHKSEISGA